MKRKNTTKEIYQNRSLEIQKKAAILLQLNWALIVIMTLVLVGMVVGQNWMGCVVSPLLILVFFISNWLLRRGAYNKASNIHIFVLSLLLTTTSFFSPMFIKQLWYIFSVVMLIFLDAAVITARLYQVRLVNLIGVVSVLITAGLIVTNPEETSPVVLNDIITVTMLMAVATYFSNAIFKLYKQVITLAQAESAENMRQFQKVSRVLDTLKANMRVGEQLRESTATTLNSIQTVEGELQEYQEQTEALGGQMEAYRSQTEEMSRLTDEAAEGVISQSSLITESTAAVEEMSASITNVTSVSEAKRESIRELVQTAGQGSDAMENAVQAISRIENTSHDIVNVIKIINNIVAQTNLLSMNAAIEAAHAGDSGRGFAVVAEEIRKLAGNSASNTKIVTETLKTNIESVAEASKLNLQAQDFFRKIDTDIQEISGAIEEIINSMSEISQGTAEVNEAVGSLREISVTTREMVEKVKDFMDSSRRKVVSIEEHTEESSRRIQEITGHFEGMVRETEKIDEIGKRNIEMISSIDRELASE